MNNGIYAVVKKYEQDGAEFADWLYKPSNHRDIYDKIMEITGNDHEIAADASSWCELASVGEIYEFREGEVEIMDID